jgi:hypothetical protein
LSTSFTMDFTLIIYMKTHFLLNNKNAWQLYTLMGVYLEPHKLCEQNAEF